VIRPGDHGSTFGGNPLAAAVGSAALDVLVEQKLASRAAMLGEQLASGLRAIRSNCVAEVRGRGLLLGIALHAQAGTARELALRLLERGVLAKDTHEQVLRLAPPLIIEASEIDWLLEQLSAVLS